MWSFPSRRRQRSYGIAGVVCLSVVVALAFAAYQQVFTPVVMVTVEAERAGLLLEPGADVRLRGLPVGEVRSIRPREGGGAVLEVALDEDRADLVPGNAVAAVLSTTPFGAKFVSLEASGVAQGTVAEGDVLHAARVTTETNDLWAGLQDLLVEADAGRLNAVLASMASVLEGRGDRLGAYVEDLDAYLRVINQHRPAMARDLRDSGPVLEAYADVSPDFLEMLDHLTTTSATLNQNSADYGRLLRSLTRTAGHSRAFLDAVEEPLAAALLRLGPVAHLAAVYSPALTCTIRGLDETRAAGELTFGNKVPAIQALASFLPAQEGYQYGRDLPRFATGHGPDCFSLDVGDPRPPRRVFDDGTHIFDGEGSGLEIGDPPVHVYPDLVTEEGR